MTNKTTVSISDYEAWVQSREQYAIGTNCGWCGRGLPGGAPPLIDRIVVLEVELARARAERDEARADALKYADALIAELNKTLP